MNDESDETLTGFSQCGQRIWIAPLAPEPITARLALTMLAVGVGLLFVQGELSTRSCLVLKGGGSALDEATPLKCGLEMLSLTLMEA